MITLTDQTRQVIQELRDRLDRMEQMESNIEVAWEFERMHHEGILLDNAKFIHKSIVTSC